MTLVQDFDPLLSLLGGALLGISATLLLLFNGRIAGISGIMGGAITESGDRDWRLSFLLGLLVGGAALLALNPSAFGKAPDVPTWMAAIAGLLVGVGTTVGSGCTSGHGVCGLPRLSVRSFVAVLTFITTAAIAVVMQRALRGGA
jgi:hypothetical protein